MKSRTLLLLLISPLALSGCAGALIGAGATVGVAAAQEGGLERALSDAQIQAAINKMWLEHDAKLFVKLDLTVNQGRVLITGVVQNPEARVEAVRLAWKPKGVKQVINEIRVAKSGGIMGFGRDTWITTRLRSAITFNRDIQSINYSIDTVQGTVYLMGVAQNQQELNRVTQIARTIPDVKQVVSYVKIVGKPLSETSGTGVGQPMLQPSPSTQSSPPVDSMGAESWPDETPTKYNAYGNDTSGSQPIELVPQPVEQEQLR